MGSRTSGFYRHDLDGLRGVAIAMVAVFHIWFGRVSGGVDVFLALSGLLLRRPAAARRADPGCVAAAGARGHPAGAAAAAGAGGGARRRRGADDPGTARDPLGDLRRPEPGQPGLLPELGAGQHRVGLSARRRDGQPAAAHLVDVGAGPVLHRLPGADLRRRRAASARVAAPPRGRLRGAAGRADRRVVRVRGHRARRRSGDRLLQQLRAGMGAAARRAGGRAGAVRAVADVAADDHRDGRAGGDPVAAAR